MNKSTVKKFAIVAGAIAVSGFLVDQLGLEAQAQKVLPASLDSRAQLITASVVGAVVVTAALVLLRKAK